MDNSQLTLLALALLGFHPIASFAALSIVLGVIGTGKELSRHSEKEFVAKQLDSEIRRELKSIHAFMTQKVTRIGELLTRMGDERLWKDLGFPSFDDYITKIHREFAKSRSKAFNLLAVYQLTKGDNAIPAEMVDRMGQKKAVELTRLQPHQRTPDVIAVALTQPLSKVRNVVTARRNETLPPHEQKPMVRMFALLLPEDTCDELNELLDEMEYAEGVRDGDMTRTLRQKAMDAIVKGARLFYQQELAEAAEYRAAKEAFDARTGVEADEDEEQL